MKSCVLSLLTTVFLLSNCTIPKTQADLLIINAVIHSGDGTERFDGAVAIQNDKIIHVGNSENIIALDTIDVQYKVMSPGFIDMHAHLDPISIYPECESHLQQGVTTALGGPDGSCPLPLGEFLDETQHGGVGMNVAWLIGHNSVRTHVMGLDDREPEKWELDSMKEMISTGMKEGAFGISTGLKYLPGSFSKLEEVIEVSKSASALGGFYTTHLREEGLGLLPAVEEAINIADKADIGVVLTHHKVMGPKMWGSSEKTLAMVNEANENGLDVMMDQYPYSASFTGISVIIPTWAMAGGRVSAFKERIQDPILRDSIKNGIIFNLINDRGGNDLRRIQISKFNYLPEYNGKTLYDWALDRGLEPTPENGAELVIEAQINGGASCIFHVMDEGDIKRIMAHPKTMIASDGRLQLLGKGHPHPRAYGTFPRVLGKYVRDEKVLSLSQAIHKMTGLPAARMGLTKRGIIKKGNYADLVIFDPEKIVDKGTFLDPHQYPEGIMYVIVNGNIAIKNKQLLNGTSGKVLRGPAWKKN
jgi:dihydroorotase/N-acyl-D-amino-acid deacylase